MRNDSGGFTLIELMVAMAVASIMMAVIFSSYQSQVQSRITQQETVDMNQNARAALLLMEREIRLAGTDPTGNAGAGFIAATSSQLHFNRDITGGESDSIDNDHDGTVDDPDEWYNGSATDANEEIEYRLTNDANGDGIADGFPCGLGRQVSGAGPFSIVADNIEALNFVYLDASGTVIPTPVASNRLGDIRSIEVTIIARTDAPVMMRRALDTNIYTNQRSQTVLDLSGNTAKQRRLRLTTTIRCRDLGLVS
jgi:type IV pilus assembly protein PilW